MGYDLHITRKGNWSGEVGRTISLSEWQQSVEYDPELSFYSEVGDEDRGKVASYRDEDGALGWDNGEVRAKNPERSLIAKMVAIAGILGAGWHSAFRR
jgi:hypothetical protein